MEHLLYQVIKPEDIICWTAALERAGVGVEQMAQALKKYGDLERTCRELRRTARALQVGVQQESDRLAVLKREEQRVTQSIGVVREHALAAMERASQKTLGQLAILQDEAMKYGNLQRQAAALESELGLARAFASMEPERWAGQPAEVIRWLLSGIILWTRSEGRNLEVQPPQQVCQGTILSSWHKLPWTGY